MSVLGIYSFPKSGNTWVRSILGALLKHGKQDVPDLHLHSLSDGGVYNGFRFYKHHSGHFLTEWNGETLNTTHVIHIRRNPLDVFLSYLNYQSNNVRGTALIPYETVEDIQGTDLFDMYFQTFTLTGHVDQFQRVTKDYFSNNLFWMNYCKNHENAVSIRYEDLLRDTEKTLGFLNGWLDLEPGQLTDLIEKASGQTVKDGKFFWKQQEKNYLNYLSDEQIALFLKYRGDDTAKIGYGQNYMKKRLGPDRDNTTNQSTSFLSGFFKKSAK